jgi:uncharacterized protein YjbI with pentapeptide repeats
VDQQQQSRWWKRVPWSGGIIVTLVVVLVLIRTGYAYHWTGFGQSRVNEALEPSKTLWDWLNLLIVPVVLALGGYLFTRSENLRTQKIADERRQDDIIQAYLDGMSELLTDKERPLHRAQMGDNLSTLARARTLTVLTRLAGDRKRSALQFLYESDLIAKGEAFVSESESIEVRQTVVDLRGADLNGAHLSKTNLKSANLGGANLTSANLSGSLLIEADLGSANLKSANLSEAFLSKAYLGAADLSRTDLRGATLNEAILWLTDLSEADLRETDLIGADLNSADLSRADLHGADLSRTNLLNAEGATEEELEAQAASLLGATMPNGQKYEDWLKSKGRGEAGENSGRS